MNTPHPGVAAARRALVLAACAWLLTSPPARAQTVDALWARHCAECHATDASGTDRARTLLDDDAHDPGDGSLDQRFFDSIRSGEFRNQPHAFAGRLDDHEAWSLVVYLREMQEHTRRARAGSPTPDQGVYRSAHHAYRVEGVINHGLDTPWSIEPYPVGRMLVAERPGTVRIHSTGAPGGELSRPVEGTPAVRNQGQGGLMDIALHPDFAQSGWVYLAFADAGAEGARTGMTKVVRGKIVERDGRASWTSQETIFQARPEHYLGGDVHFGCRVVFDPSNTDILFFSIGERGHARMAQDLTRPNGKVHRLHADGSVPDNNPFLDTPDAYPSIWSYGHRNPQGLVFDAEGVLWDTEHGPRGGDELNRIERAHNYGWPIISYGINYSGEPFVTPWQEQSGPDGSETLTLPIFRWLPSIGACGLDISSGSAFPEWRGDLFAGGLSGANVDRLRVRNGKVVEREELLHGLGRVRDVRCWPDGTIYVVLNGPDRVVRLVPER